MSTQLRRMQRNVKKVESADREMLVTKQPAICCATVRIDATPKKSVLVFEFSTHFARALTTKGITETCAVAAATTGKMQIDVSSEGLKPKPKHASPKM